jgi:hypothetical protein
LKLPALVAVPFGVRTVILPVVVPHGTVAVIRVFEITLNEAGLPWKVTLVVPLNPEPVMVTLVPIGPLVGENVVTVRVPVADDAATVVVIPVAETTVDEVMAACADMAGTIIRTPAAARAAAVRALLNIGSLRLILCFSFALL